MFCKSWFHALVREHRIFDFVLKASCAYAWCDTLLHCLAFALYTQNFWSSRDSYCAFVTIRAFCKMDKNTERRTKSMASIWYPGGVVGD